jgi:uncharacterized protein
MEERLLPRRGSLWTWTIQGFRPKSPPYRDDDPESFEPYGVGYVELEGELIVEGRLTENEPERLQIGGQLEVTVVPLYTDTDGVEVLTYAFRPLKDEL